MQESNEITCDNELDADPKIYVECTVNWPEEKCMYPQQVENITQMSPKWSGALLAT